MNLESIRQEIDQVDQEIVALLEKRMQLVTQVTNFKRATGKPVLDSKREEALLKKVAALTQEKDFEETIIATFRDIMKNSRTYQSAKLAQSEQLSHDE